MNTSIRVYLRVSLLNVVYKKKVADIREGFLYRNILRINVKVVNKKRVFLDSFSRIKVKRIFFGKDFIYSGKNINKKRQTVNILDLI